MTASGRCCSVSHALLLCVVWLGAGCHHKKVQAIVLPQTTPVPLDNDTPPPTTVLPEPASPKLPAVPVAEAATKPKKVKKKNAPKPAATTAGGVMPAAPAASTGVPEARPASEPAAAAADAGISAIGALTAGSEQDPKVKVEVSDLIASNERRLNMLPPDAVRSQAALVSKVRTFQRDAQAALASGDAEGARTLATKGKLLLDDLEKSGS